MSSITTDHQFLDSGSSLPEPHFDEEATVLSARPVVPLDEVEARRSKVSFPRPWILGAALIGALLVGIFASALYYSRSEGESKLSQGMELTAGVEGRNEETPEGFSGPVSSQPQVEVAKAVEAKKSTPVIPQPAQSERASAGPEKKAQPRLVAVLREKKSNDSADDETEEDRKAARREARKDRRRTEREGRNRRSADELFRIRDIFEGAPRPRN